MFLTIDFTRDFLRLFSAGAEDVEFQLAVLAVPDSELAADGHRHANPADVLGNFIQRHTAECFSSPGWNFSPLPRPRAHAPV
jgi:hypothetical protein